MKDPVMRKEESVRYEVPAGVNGRLERRVCQLERMVDSDTWRGSGYIPKWMASEEDLEYNRKVKFSKRRRRRRRFRRGRRMCWRYPMWFGAPGIIWSPWSPWSYPRF